MNEAKFYSGTGTDLSYLSYLAVRAVTAWDYNYSKAAKGITKKFNERKEKYGTCSVCARYNTNYQWCQSCDSKLLAQSWTSSGNENLDKIIRSTQLEAKGFNSCYYLQWIPYDQLIIEKEAGEGGFAKVYMGCWSNGPRFVQDGQRYYCTNGRVALKKFKNSQDPEELSKELQNHIKFMGPYHKGVVDIYGVSQDPNTKEYVLVMRYTDSGSFRDYMKSESNYTGWSDRITILHSIILGLSIFHKEGLMHCDLHSGNILYFQYLEQQVMIGDLGLSSPADKVTSSKFGVLPYVAPEILNGGPYTQKSDIYSFGILMSETSTYQQPFKDQPHDQDLALRICSGLRPSFSDNTPECYIKLAYKCTDADPKKRPTANEILKIIKSWKDAIEEVDLNVGLGEIDYSEEQLDELKEIRKIFKEADKKPINPSTITATVHPNAVYTSRLLNFTNLPQPVNSNKVTIISNNNESKQIELTIPDDF